MASNPRTRSSPTPTTGRADQAADPVEVLAAGGSDRWLTARQLQILDLIVGGVPIKTIARTTGVGRSTIYEWRKQPAFVAEESRRREFLRAERGDELLGLLDEAASVIRGALAEGDVTVAIKVLQSYAPDRLLHAVGGMKTLEQLVRAEADRKCRDARQAVADDAGNLDVSLRRASVLAESREELRQQIAGGLIVAATRRPIDDQFTDATPRRVGGRAQRSRGAARRAPVDERQLALFPTGS